MTNSRLLKRASALAAVAVTASLLAPAACALSYDAASNGTASQPGYSFSASGDLGLKTTAGYTALGIQGGNAGNEIDSGEWLQINFATPQTVDYITIAFLYNGFEFGDAYEKAKIAADNETFSLTAVGNTLAFWTGQGGVDNVSPAVLQGGGVWTIYNPFSGPVSTITFSAVNMFRYAQSDFGVAGFGTQGNLVPDGGTTVALLGLALAGLPFLRRRSTKA